jgi:Domain of unknown function (DUF4331)
VSHYLDSALARQDVRLDITDVYLFRGEVGTVFVLSVNSSAAGSDTPAGFHPDAHYDFRIDTDGDVVEDLTYRVIFGQLDQAGRQPLELHQLAGAEAREHTAPGTLLAWGSTEAVVTVSQGLRLWAGLAAESFYVEPTVLDAVRRAVRFGRRVELGAWQPRRAVNAFAGTTVYAIVLEVPDGALAGLLGPERRLGFWGTTTLATDTGGWRPINRMGLPMVQSIFNPADDERASDYNTTHPADDRANYGELFAGLVAGVVAAHGTADDPRAYGATVARLLLPDVLIYQVGSAASYSFACRNGRGLTDNAPEVMFSLVTNHALSGGLSKRHAAGKPRPLFPYVPPPPSAMDLSA